MSMKKSIKGTVFPVLSGFCIGMVLSGPTIAKEYPQSENNVQTELLDTQAQSTRTEMQSLSKSAGEETPATLSLSSPPKKSGGFVMWHISFENNN